MSTIETKEPRMWMRLLKLGSFNSATVETAITEYEEIEKQNKVLREVLASAHACSDSFQTELVELRQKHMQIKAELRELRNAKATTDVHLAEAKADSHSILDNQLHATERLHFFRDRFMNAEARGEQLANALRREQQHGDVTLSVELMRALNEYERMKS